MHKFFWIVTMLVVAASQGALAASGGDIRVTGAWARATPPGAATGGVYLELQNMGPADKLVAASTPLAGSVEIHSMTMEGNVMQMRKLDSGLALPAGKAVALKAGANHLMLLDLKKPLRQGERFQLVLKTQRGVSIPVSVQVTGPGGPPPHMGTH